METIASYSGKISVLIPVYNVEKYLPACLDSVLAQTYTNIEILLVDDGSNDKSGDICDAYALKDKRVVVIHKANEGQAVARNVLVENAKGIYFAFVDSDDVVAPSYIEDLYGLVVKYNCKISLSVLQTFKNADIIINDVHEYEEKLIDSYQAINWMNYQIKFDTWPVCKLYHRSVFEKLRYPLLSISEDLALTPLLFLESESIAYSNRVNYYYRLHDASTEGRPFTSTQMDAAIKVIKYMDERYANIYQIQQSYRCRRLSYVFHMIMKMPTNYGNQRFFINILKRDRLSVLLDHNARSKARIACLFSYLGIPFLKYMFKFVDRRG